MTNTVSQNKPPAFFRTLIKLQNPFMKWLLRSPFHGIVSSSYMLITFNGRKSGKRYTTPVQYAKDDKQVFVITSEGYTWWKNLRGGANVTLVLKGKTQPGRASVSQDIDIISELVHKIYPHLAPEQMEKFVAGKVAVTIHLYESQNPKGESA